MPNKESIIALIALTLVNLLNYFDRYIPSVTKDLIKAELKMTDFQTGVMFTAFVCCYMLVSPVVGMLSDRRLFKRKYVIVAGVIVWSIATTATGLCQTFWQLLIPRIVFGIGEAAYCTLAPALLSDFFVPEQRNVVMAIFLGATPIGCALGYGVAGALGELIGWRMTFMLCGIPGLFSLFVLFLREPEPGEKDIPTAEKTSLLSSEYIKTSDDESDQSQNRTDTQQITQNEEEVGSLLSGQYIIAVAGYVAVTFGMGGISDWLPVFFVRYHGISLSSAGLLNGIVVVVGGMFGTFVGSVAAEWTGKYITRRHPYFLLSGVTMMICGLLAICSLYFFQDSMITIQILFGLTLFFGWCYNGPINAIIQNSVPASQRSRANGISVLSIHLLGDAFSPSIIGMISDATRGDLRGALMLVPASILLSGYIWFCGWITIPYHKKEKVTYVTVQDNAYKKLPTLPNSNSDGSVSS